MRAPECQAAIDRLAAHLAGGDHELAALEPALAHVGSCARCRAGLRFLAQALTRPATDRLTCDECVAELPWLLSSESPPSPRRRRITTHLATCPHCAAIYAELVTMDDHAWDDPQIPAPAPRPRLAFLRREPEPPPWRYQPGRLQIQLAALFGPLAHTPAAPAGVRAQAPAGTARELRLPETVAADLRVTVTCQPMLDRPDRCAIVIRVEIPSRGGWPHLKGTRVTLQRGEAPLGELETDAFGTVVFPNLAVADLAELVVAVMNGV